MSSIPCIEFYKCHKLPSVGHSSFNPISYEKSIDLLPIRRSSIFRLIYIALDISNAQDYGSLGWRSSFLTRKSESFSEYILLKHLIYLSDSSSYTPTCNIKIQINLAYNLDNLGLSRSQPMEAFGLLPPLPLPAASGVVYISRKL